MGGGGGPHRGEDTVNFWNHTPHAKTYISVDKVI